MLTPDQQVDKLREAFGDNAFSGTDVANVLGIDKRGTGGIFKYMLARRQVRKVKSGTYQFLSAQKTPEAHISAEVTPVVDQSPVDRPIARIGELYLHERLLLIADTVRQEGSDAVRIYTTIIEVDPATKHPRNKIVNFIKARDPREYAQAMAWLDSMAGEPPHVVDETALELAAELERKLNAANAKIAELTRKIDAIRGAL